MNGTQQKTHRTVTDRLAQTLTTVAEGTAHRFVAVERRIDGIDKVLRQQINDERTHRLKMADEQRAYVDRGDKLTDAKVDTFLRRGFWSRLNWLLTGR